MQTSARWDGSNSQHYRSANGARPNMSHNRPSEPAEEIPPAPHPEDYSRLTHYVWSAHPYTHHQCARCGPRSNLLESITKCDRNIPSSTEGLVTAMHTQGMSWCTCRRVQSHTHGYLAKWRYSIDFCCFYIMQINS